MTIQRNFKKYVKINRTNCDKYIHSIQFQSGFKTLELILRKDHTTQETSYWLNLKETKKVGVDRKLTTLWIGKIENLNAESLIERSNGNIKESIEFKQFTKNELLSFVSVNDLMNYYLNIYKQ